MKRASVEDDGGRRFSRTLDEAFPTWPAPAIEIGRRPPLWRAKRWLISFIRRVQK